MHNHGPPLQHKTINISRKVMSYYITPNRRKEKPVVE